jgi:hypothetical protein
VTIVAHPVGVAVVATTFQQEVAAGS